MVRIGLQLGMRSAHVSCSARNGAPPEPTEVLKTTQVRCAASSYSNLCHLLKTCPEKWANSPTGDTNEMP